jgi:hypothetical protein
MDLRAMRDDGVLKRRLQSPEMRRYVFQRDGRSACGWRCLLLRDFGITWDKYVYENSKAVSTATYYEAAGKWMMVMASILGWESKRGAIWICGGAEFMMHALLSLNGLWVFLVSMRGWISFSSFTSEMADEYD